MEDLKRKLEVLLPRTAAVDQSQQRRVEAEAVELASQKERKEKISQASGNLVTAALSLAGELMGPGESSPDPQTVSRLTDKLSQSVDRDEQGRPELKISLPNDEALKSLAEAIANYLACKESEIAIGMIRWRYVVSSVFRLTIQPQRVDCGLGPRARRG